MASELKNTISELIEDLKIKQQKKEEGGYDDRIDALLKDLYTGATEGFNYDAEKDPEYQAAVKDYNIEADRSMRDVLGQGAARTGGIASTSAIAAASQARDYQMTGLADEKAKLYNNAMSKREAELSAKYQILQALENLDEREKDNYLSLLQMQESIADKDKEEAQSRIQSMIAMGMTPDDELISAAGWDRAYVNSMQRYAVGQMSTAEVQQLLNSHGAGLSVDGSWGPKTEAAYQQIFGTPSGRQTAGIYSSGGNGGNGGGTGGLENPEKPDNSGDNKSAAYNEAFAVMKSDFANGKLTTNQAIQRVNDLYAMGLINAEDKNYLISYAKNYNRKR